VLQVLQADGNNSKALYRRGVARLHLGWLDGAEEDLMSAKSSNPKGKFWITSSHYIGGMLVYAGRMNSACSWRFRYCVVSRNALER